MKYVVLYEEVEEGLEWEMGVEEKNMGEVLGEEEDEVGCCYVEMGEKVCGWIEWEGYVSLGLRVKEVGEIWNRKGSYVCG